MKFEINDELAGKIEIEFKSGRKPVFLEIRPLSYNTLKRVRTEINGAQKLTDDDKAMKKISAILEKISYNSDELPINEMPIYKLRELLTHSFVIARDGDARSLEEKKTEDTGPRRRSSSKKRTSRSRR